jgi:hypothetical protein
MEMYMSGEMEVVFPIAGDRLLPVWRITGRRLLEASRERSEMDREAMMTAFRRSSKYQSGGFASRFQTKPVVDTRCSRWPSP